MDDNLCHFRNRVHDLHPKDGLTRKIDGSDLWSKWTIISKVFRDTKQSWMVA